MHARPTTCASAGWLALAVAAFATDLSAQSIIRETATTLVLPIPGVGGGPGTGMGQGTAGTVLPATLSQTGAFSDLRRLIPARGVVPYEPNASLWSDHAKKIRWFALTSPTSTFGFQRDDGWTLPTGAVWIKQFDLELRRGDPTSVRHVETRFLVKEAHGGVTGYTYQWNDEQTDAILVPQPGAQQAFTVTENGVARTQTWIFPGRFDCQTCHNAPAGQVLSFNTRQLNRAGAGGVNQLAALAQAGYLDVGAVPAPAVLPALIDPADNRHPIELRVRSYLDVNCSHCHRPGIPNTGGFDARAGTPLSLTHMVNGALEFPAAEASHRVFVPGSTAASNALARVGTRGAGRMPSLATNERDLASEALLRAWIADLATPLPPSRVLNFSTRAQVGSGAGVVITGLVVGPGAMKRVLIRAIGPGLAPFGVAEPLLAAPVVTLFAGRESFLVNSRWNSAPNADDIRGAAQRVGAFALAEGGADSALLATLSPGAYTIQVSGAGSTTGAVLVEVFEVP